MKKVAIISTAWENDTFQDLLDGVNEYLEGKDIAVDVFNAYDISDSKIRSQNELSIHLLAAGEHYDGLLIYTNSSAGDSILTQVINSFKKNNKPVISIDRKIDGIPYVEIDNYYSEYYLIEHMIKEHHCKTFQFVGGIKNYFDNEERFRAFKDCLNACNIPIDERYISFHNFIEKDGRDAYRMIKNQDLPVPEVVVCANDKMAVGYCLEAYEDGLYPPRDFLICGFDNINDGQEYFPSITSINKNTPEAFIKGFEHIEAFYNNQSIPDKTTITGFIKINESCGCNQYFDIRENYRKAILKGKAIKYADRKYRKLRLDLCACKNFEELRSALRYGYESLDLYESAICIKDEIFNQDETVTNLCTSNSMKCYSSDFVSELNPYENVKPSAWLSRNEKVFIYSPLYFHTEILGYSVFPYHKGSYNKIYHEYYLDSVSIAVENVRQKIMIDTMNQKFKDLYVADQMTGLYNRFGYSALSGKMFAKYNGRIYIIYIDLDNLKSMNDNYGHDLGDKAIIGAAHCISKVFGEDTIKVRMGGDEFLIMGEFVDEESILKNEAQLEKEMEEYTKVNNLPIPLQASFGHSFNIKQIETTELGRLMKSADDNMYKFKQGRKNNRK